MRLLEFHINGQKCLLIFHNPSTLLLVLCFVCFPFSIGMTFTLPVVEHIIWHRRREKNADTRKCNKLERMNTHTHSRNDSFTKIVNHNSWMKSWIAQKTAIGHGIEIPKRCHSIFQFWQANREHKKRTHINSKSKQTKRSRERELEKKKKVEWNVSYTHVN